MRRMGMKGGRGGVMGCAEKATFTDLTQYSFNSVHFKWANQKPILN